MATQNFFKDCRPESSPREQATLEMYRGDTLQFRALLTEAGSPEDIGGGYFWFHVKDDMNDPDSAAVIVKTSDNGITILDEEAGIAVITVDPIDTISLGINEATSYYWDLQYQDSLGRVQTVALGSLKVRLDVTQNIGYVILFPMVLKATGWITNATPAMEYAAVTNLSASATLTARAVVYRNITILDGAPGIDELQEFHIQAAVGLFSFSFTGSVASPVGPEITGLLPLGASNASITNNLEALPNIDPGDVEVTGGPIGQYPVRIRFDGAYTTVDMNQITLNVGNLA